MIRGLLVQKILRRSSSASTTHHGVAAPCHCRQLKFPFANAGCLLPHVPTWALRMIKISLPNEITSLTTKCTLCLLFHYLPRSPHSLPIRPNSLPRWKEIDVLFTKAVSCHSERNLCRQFTDWLRCKSDLKLLARSCSTSVTVRFPVTETDAWPKRQTQLKLYGQGFSTRRGLYTTAFPLQVYTSKGSILALSFNPDTGDEDEG